MLIQFTSVFPIKSINTNKNNKDKMEELRKSTLVKRSEFMSTALQWNPEQFVNGRFIPDRETIAFFENILSRNCQRAMDNFCILLAEPTANILCFYETLNLDFLIFALHFYKCELLEDELCQKIITLSQRNYISVQGQLQENANIDCYKQFSDKLKRIKSAGVQHIDDLVRQFNTVRVREPITFAAINQHLYR
jgi:hypothetical protein